MVGRVLVLVVVIGACTDLPRLEHDICGNSVVEAGEDCDGAVDPTRGNSLACGAAADEHACRYTCAGASCPAGWGCGDDGVCRYGTGELVAGLAIEVPHTDLAVGAIDDRRGSDIVAFGPTGTRVVFDTTTQLIGRPDAIVRPGTVADLDADGRDDVVVSLAVALSVWRGEVDRAMTPIAYAPFLAPEQGWFLPLRIPRVGNPTPNPDALAILQRTATGTAVELLAALATPLQGKTTIATVPPEAFGPIALRADLDAPSPQDELVLVAAGQPEALLIRVIEMNGALRFQSVTVPMPLGEHSDGRVAAADVDGDGDLDLLLGTLDGGGFGLAAALNTGNLTFAPASHAPVQLLATTLATPSAASNVPSAPQPFPLAVGDLDGDGRFDAVSPDAIFLQRGPGWSIAYRRVTSTAWREALIASVDRGARDVVVAEGPRLTVLRQGTTGFTAIPIPTSGSISHLRAGDFDGDRIEDVVFKERSVAGDLARILFGSDDDFDDPLAITRAETIVRLEVGRVADANGGYDSADEVIAVVSDATGSRAAFIPGAGDRSIGSPLVLSAGGPGFDRPLAAMAGHFRASTGTDLAVLADRAGNAQLWLLFATAGAAYVVGNAGNSNEPMLDRFAVHRVASADLRRDGTDELVLLGVAADGVTELVVVDFAVTGPPVVDRIALDVGEPVDLAAGDLDRDGADEVFAIGMRGVRVLRDRQVSVLDIPATSACVAQLDADADRELVLLVGDRLHVLDAALVEQATLPAPAGATIVRTADRNGDGVDDLLVGDGTLITPLVSRTQVP